MLRCACAAARRSGFSLVVARLRNSEARGNSFAVGSHLRHHSSGGGGSDAMGAYVPPDSHRRIGELQQHMRALYSAGRYGEARDSGLECLALARDAFGEAHPVSASVANNVALMHKSLGETDSAAALYREALSCYRTLLGEHASTATALCNLALLLRERASLDTASTGEDSSAGHTSHHDEARREAETLLTEALAMRRKVLGEAHPDVGAALQQLASVCDSSAEGEERKSALLREAVELLERADGEGPVDAGSGNRSTGLRLANALNSLALLRKRQGHLEEAEPLYTRALELRERALGAAHPETVACRHNLAELARAAGDEIRATQLQAQILALLESPPTKN